MPTPLVTYRCIDCGAEVTRKRRSDQVRVCFECGVQRSVTANMETHNVALDRRRRNQAARNGG